jgi:hypothetical protein
MKPAAVAVLVIVSALIATVGLAAGSSDVGPANVTLVLVGTVLAGHDEHSGTFTASPPLCGAGTWLGDANGTRTFTCTDGSGTFTASFDQPGTVEIEGGTAPWSIIAGTAAWADMRGTGEGTAVTAGTDPPAWTDRWTGVADRDTAPPSLTRLTFSRRGSQYVARFVLSDRPSSAHVSYDATLIANYRQIGPTHVGSGLGAVSVGPMRIPSKTRRVRIFISLIDDVGNKTSVNRTFSINPQPR